MFGFGDNWNARGKNCYVTGGSQGLGLALATLLAKKGANVTIVARNVDKLENALEVLKNNGPYEDQIFRCHSFSLNTAQGSEDALDAECKQLISTTKDKCTTPDAFFLCAGSSQPGYFVEKTEGQLLYDMEQAYWVEAWTAHAAFKRLVQRRRRGKIVFVGSTLSLMSFLGYSSYTPGKHALKGLAETLRSEGLLYDIDVHIFFAPAMHSPGLAEETKIKPALTRKFEEDDNILSCEDAAEAMLKGVEKGKHHITATLISRIFNNMSRGAAPLVDPFLGPILDCIGWIAAPVWRRQCDALVINSKEEHLYHITQNGL